MDCVLCCTIIAIPINLVKFFNNMSNKNKLNERNTQLNAEITTLTKSLNDKGGVALVFQRNYPLIKRKFVFSHI